jgi:hypothetical protein
MTGGSTPRRRSTLAAALGFVQLAPGAPELQLLHRWLDSWRGVGDIAVGTHRPGWTSSSPSTATATGARRSS